MRHDVMRLIKHHDVQVRVRRLVVDLKFCPIGTEAIVGTVGPDL
jgi:hypothetical protein